MMQKLLIKNICVLELPMELLIPMVTACRDYILNYINRLSIVLLQVSFRESVRSV